MERPKLLESALIFVGGLSLGAALLGVGSARYHKHQVDEMQQQWRHRGVFVDWRGLRECLPDGSHCDDLSQVLYTGGSPRPGKPGGQSAVKNIAKAELPDPTHPSDTTSEPAVGSEVDAAVVKPTKAETSTSRSLQVVMAQQVSAKVKPSAAIPMKREEVISRSEDAARPVNARVEAAAGHKTLAAAQETKPVAVRTMGARVPASFKGTKTIGDRTVVARTGSKSNGEEARTAFPNGEPLATPPEQSTAQHAPTASATTLYARQEVARMLEHWASTLARGKINDHLAFYADEINPYFEAKHPVSKDTVRKEKSRLVAGGTLASLSVDYIRVVFSRPGSAVAVFEKTWRTRNSNGEMTGHQTWSRVQLERKGDGWQITGEQDLTSQDTHSGG